MTHQLEANLSPDLLQLLCDPDAGRSRFTAVLQLLLNEAMKLERADVLGAKPYECTVRRAGYAKGYKPKTLATGLSQLDLEVP